MADSNSTETRTKGSFAKPIAPRRSFLVVGIMLTGVGLTTAYWIIWFGGGRALLATSQTSSYLVFENAFPVADGWLAITLLLGALGLLRQRPWGLLWSLLAGGAGIYLACMDVLFDLENGTYIIAQGADPSGVIIEIVINVLTFAISITVISYVWRHRRWLLRTQ